jgi:thioredoxin 1
MIRSGRPPFALARKAIHWRITMAAKNRSTRDFNRLISEGITLVDFNAQWCLPCRTQETIVRALEKELQGLASITILDVDKHQEVALRLGVQSIPTIIIFKDGIERKRFIGLQSGTKLSDALKPFLDRRRTDDR